MRGLLFLAILAFPGLAQEESVRFTRITAALGLSHDGVRCLLQDRQGFLWIGTERGLNRYDGYGFTWFQHDDERPESLSDNVVRDLAEDAHGNLWVATESGGLSLFDRDSETFRSFRHDPSDPASLPNDRVYTLATAPGAVWIGTKTGLARLDTSGGIPAKPRFTRFQHSEADPQSLANDRVAALLLDSDGTLWVGSKGGLDRLVSLSPPRFAHHRHDPARPDSLNDDEVYALREDRDGDLWIGTWGGGCLSRLPRAERGKESPSFVRYQVAANVVYGILVDRGGDLWLATGDAGAVRLPYAAKGSPSPRFLSYRHEATDPRSLGDRAVAEILEDAQGTIWAGTFSAGLSKWDRQTERFLHYRHIPSRPDSLSHENVAAVIEGRDGTIWVGGPAGLDRIAPRAHPGDPLVIGHFKADPADASSLSANRVYSLLEDRRGRLFVGTIGGGLNVLVPGARGFVHFRGGRDAPNGLANDAVLTLLEDAKGTLWVGTYAGLHRFEEAAELPRSRFAALRHDPKDVTTLPHDSVSCLLEDRSRRLWVGTYAGLCRLREDGTSFARISLKPAGRDVSGTFIHALFEDAEGALWIGTADAGVLRHDPATGRTTGYRARQGLGGDLVFSLQAGTAGQLWLGTPFGLYRMDVRGGQFFRYGAADGVQADIFGPAACRGASGRLYFGGAGGLTVFRPEEIRDEDAPPGVALTGFLLANRKAPIGQGGLPRHIGRLQEVTLTPAQSIFALEFSALDLRRPERVRYTYRMEGFDDAWIETDAANRRATYTNLSPGLYTFRVRASAFGQRFGEPGASVRVRVLPPWWRTWWARLLGLGALALALVGWHRARTHRLRATAELLERQVKERTSQLAEAQEKLARILDSAPEALGDVDTWARTTKREVEQAIGCAEIAVFKLEGGLFRALIPTGVPAPPVSAVEEAARSGASLKLSQREESGRVTVPVTGPSGQLYGALVVPAPPAWGEHERRLVHAFALQLGGTLEMRRLRGELASAAFRREEALREYHERGVATLRICPVCGRCDDHNATLCASDGSPLEAPRPIPFRLLDRYRFERTLGEGGMGVVLAAHDERLGREVAIKLIRPEHFDNPSVRLRLEQEARAVARIAHPNVIALFDSGELPDGTAYLVMERLVGRDLGGYLSRYGRGRPGQVAELARQGAAALGAAHRMGLVHRDLKPENLFLVDDPKGLRLKVLDFGLAKSMTVEKGATVTGLVVGTPGYMSPEQVYAEQLDARSDVYSFAVVLYEALTGRRVVDAVDVGAAMIAVATKEPPPASELVPELGAGVDGVLGLALAKERERRPADVEAWAELLVAELARVTSDVRGWPDAGMPVAAVMKAAGAAGSAAVAAAEAAGGAAGTRERDEPSSATAISIR